MFALVEVSHNLEKQCDICSLQCYVSGIRRCILDIRILYRLSVIQHSHDIAFWGKSSVLQGAAVPTPKRIEVPTRARAGEAPQGHIR